MHIPRIWMKSTIDERRPDGQSVKLVAWGWGDDPDSAWKSAVERLERLVGRVRGGEPLPDFYEYSQRPLREEILDTIPGSSPSEPAAIITRNAYGAQILNVPDLLFLDIDFEPQGVFKRLFGKRKSPEDIALDKLREALDRESATFRIYRTASGLRAMAIDRTFDPKSGDVQDLMKRTGADPAFARMCVAQNSFRARLTPKPWRCGCPLPPGRHPRQDGEMQDRFAEWLRGYETASARHATCRYLETLGHATPDSSMQSRIDRHDRATRCAEPLDLA